MKMARLAAVVVTVLFGLSVRASAATLGLAPAFGTVAVGDFLPLNILLDTESVAIDGVDIHSLRYDPLLLEVVDSDPGTPGTQIAAGFLMPVTVFNFVDSTAGTIDFSQLTLGGSTFTGGGVLASLTFRALAPGTANVSFDFTPGSTLDSNVASGGADILSAVTNGNYRVTATAVPEPQSALLLTTGLLGMITVRRCRRP